MALPLLVHSHRVTASTAAHHDRSAMLQYLAAALPEMSQAAYPVPSDKDLPISNVWVAVMPQGTAVWGNHKVP